MNKRYGYGRPARYRQKQFPKLASIIVLSLILAAAYYFSVYHTHLSNPTTSVVTPTYSQQQSIDVNTVGGAIGQYTQANRISPTHLSPNGSVLVMCNATCDPTTSQISQLVVYQAKNVQMRSYVPGMLVASRDAMYLVPGATCRSRSAIGDSTSRKNSMIILYASDSANGLSQHCVML